MDYDPTASEAWAQRNQFAAAALAALVENEGRYSARPGRYDQRKYTAIAKEAWKFADVMLEAQHDEKADT